MSLTAEHFSPSETIFNQTSDTQESARYSVWHQVTNEAPSAVYGILQTLKEKLPRLRRNRFQIWDSTPYVERRHLSKADVGTFFDEYAAMFAIKEYPYSLYGIPDDQDILISDRCRNHTTRLAELGGETKRSVLETWVAQTLEHWLSNPNLPLGSKLVTLSPRGQLKEGYPGTNQENYVFINVYEKVPLNVHPTGFRLLQYTSYDHNADLQGIQQELLTELHGQPYYPLPLPTQPSNESHHLISQIIALPTHVSPNQLRTIFHDPVREQHWPQRLKDLPQLPMKEFGEHRTALTDFCQTQFELLLQTQPPAEVILQFDELIGLVRKYLLRWVQDNAHNYQDKLKASEYSLTGVSPEELVAKIAQVWAARIKKLHHEKLSLTEKNVLKETRHSTRLDPHLPLARFASMAHCIIMTGPSLAVKVKLSRVIQFSSAELKNPTTTLTASEKESLAKFLHKLTPLYVTNRSTGLVETYYLHIHDPKHISEYQYSCYQESSQDPIMGPCGVALEADPLVDSTTLMTASRYKEYQELLMRQKIEQLITDNQDLNPEEQQHLEKLLERLGRRLFRVSVSDMIAGVTSYQWDAVSALPDEYYQKLSAATDPFLALAQLVAELEQEDVATLEETVVYSRAPAIHLN